MGLDLFDAIGRKLRYERDLCELKLSTASKELEDALARDNESRLEFKARQEERAAAEEAACEAETKTQIAKEVLVQAERKVAVATSVVANKDAQIVQFDDCDNMLQQWIHQSEERHEQALKVAQEDAAKLKLEIERLHGSVQQNIAMCGELEKVRQECTGLHTSLESATAICTVAIGERDAFRKQLECAVDKLAQHQKEACILRGACEQETKRLRECVHVAKTETAAALQQVDVLRNNFEDGKCRRTSCPDDAQVSTTRIGADIPAKNDEGTHAVRIDHACAGHMDPKVRSINSVCRKRNVAKVDGEQCGHAEVLHWKSSKSVVASGNQRPHGAADILKTGNVRSQEQGSVLHRAEQHGDVDVGCLMLTEVEGASTSRITNRNDDQAQQQQEQQEHAQRSNEPGVLLQQLPEQPPEQQLKQQEERRQEKYEHQDFQQQPSRHLPHQHQQQQHSGQQEQEQDQQQQQNKQYRQQQKQEKKQPQQKQVERQDRDTQHQQQSHPQAPSMCLAKQQGLLQRLPSGSFAERQALAIRAGKRKDRHAAGCHDCGRVGPLFYDETDSGQYCSDCWASFYGQLPPSAASVSASLACVVGVDVAIDASKSYRTSASKRAQLQNVSSNASRLPEDAPRGHRAHAECKIKDSRRIYFHYHRGGLRIPFHVTACCGSRHAAEVIARACYMKFEQGWQKADVLVFRNMCYARLAEGAWITPAGVGNAGAERRAPLPGMQELRAGA